MTSKQATIESLFSTATQSSFNKRHRANSVNVDTNETSSKRRKDIIDDDESDTNSVNEIINAGSQCSN
jgi:hypothetical protein